jgi:hypothetical protein
VEALTKLGISCVALTKEATDADPNLFKKAFVSCDFQMIYASPEILLKPGGFFMNSIVPKHNSTFMSRLIAVAVDECHVTLDWQGFRRKYKELGLLRDCMLSIPFVLLSATLPPHYASYVRSSVRLRNPQSIKISVRRSNIRIIISKIEGPGLEDLKMLVPTTPETDIPPTLIYIDNKDEAGRIARTMREWLPPEHQSNKHRLIRVYSGALAEKARNSYMKALKSGKTKIFICTDACGMGIDLRCIKRVVQWRIHSQLKLSGLWQRFGRGGRDLSINAVAVAFVQENLFLVPDEPGDPQEDNPAGKNKKQPNACDPEFCHRMRLPVTVETQVETAAIMREIWDRPLDLSTQKYRSECWKKIDPALLKFINTEGCRHKCGLAYFDDPETYAEEGPGDCDNCMIAELMLTGDVSAGTDLEGIPLSLSAMYRAHFPAAERLEESIVGVSDEEDLVLKINSDRVDLLERDIQHWRHVTFKTLSVRFWLTEDIFLTDVAIRKIVRNVSRIDSEQSLKHTIRTLVQFPGSGLTKHIPALFTCIKNSLDASTSLQILPVLSPTPSRQLALDPMAGASLRVLNIITSADIDAEMEAEAREKREEKFRKRMKKHQVKRILKPRRKCGEGKKAVALPVHGRRRSNIEPSIVTIESLVSDCPVGTDIPSPATSENTQTIPQESFVNTDASAGHLPTKELDPQHVPPSIAPRRKTPTTSEPVQPPLLDTSTESSGGNSDTSKNHPIATQSMSRSPVKRSAFLNNYRSPKRQRTLLGGNSDSSEISTQNSPSPVLLNMHEKPALACPVGQRGPLLDITETSNRPIRSTGKRRVAAAIRFEGGKCYDDSRKST